MMVLFFLILFAKGVSAYKWFPIGYCKALKNLCPLFEKKTSLFLLVPGFTPDYQL
jgi:hypothetical protein